jgi:hypothetical protein
MRLKVVEVCWSTPAGLLYQIATLSLLGRTRRCSRRRGTIGFWDFIAHRCPAAAELGRSAVSVTVVGVVSVGQFVVASWPAPVGG